MSEQFMRAAFSDFDREIDFFSFNRDPSGGFPNFQSSFHNNNNNNFQHPDDYEDYFQHNFNNNFKNSSSFTKNERTNFPPTKNNIQSSSSLSSSHNEPKQIKYKDNKIYDV
jgi:hypothetical protein